MPADTRCVPAAAARVIHLMQRPRLMRVEAGHDETDGAAVRVRHFRLGPHECVMAAAGCRVIGYGPEHHCQLRLLRRGWFQPQFRRQVAAASHLVHVRFTAPAQALAEFERPAAPVRVDEQRDALHAGLWRAASSRVVSSKVRLPTRSLASSSFSWRLRPGSSAAALLAAKLNRGMKNGANGAPVARSVATGSRPSVSSAMPAMSAAGQQEMLA